MIELRNVSAGYGRKSTICGITMPVRPGVLTVLLGPNGSGKSTLLKTISGLMPPLAGQVLVDGVPAEELTSRQMARKVTYLAQSRNTPDILARRMVLHGRFPYVPYPRRYGKEDYEIAEEALRRAGAADLADRFMSELSGGERQKIYLAMALAQDTGTILMDEPTTFLDVGHQLRVLEISRQLARSGKAILLVLHDVCEALRWADEVAAVSKGMLVFRGVPEEAFQDKVLDDIFGVQIRRFLTEDGWQYYCSDRAGGQKAAEG